MKIVSSLIIMLVLLIGCKGETGPAGPSLKGNISGYIVLFDSLGKRMSNNSGVQVSIEGTNYSATSDSTGRWSINDVSTGTYTINSSKLGYSPDKLLGYSFAGGGNGYLYQRYLFKLPSFQVSNITVGRSVAEKYINISGTVTSPNPETIALFFDKSATVSSEQGRFNFYWFVYTSLAGSTNSFSTYVYSSSLDYYGFSSGDTVYIRAYSHARGGSISYTDPGTGKLVITTVGTSSSNVGSAIVP